MAKIPHSFQSVTTMLVHILAVPVFFLGFILTYQSRWMIRFLEAGNGMAVFNTLMLMCILLGIMCASRIPMTALREKIHPSWWQ